MKFLRSWLAVIVLIAGFTLVAPGPASAAPYCGITWGSLAKTGGTLTSSPVTNVRAGEHSCYDRMVVDLNGPVTGYSVRYVSAVYTEGQGALVPLRGGAYLQVTVLAPASYANGSPSYVPANRNEVVNVCGYQTFRQVAYAGSSEAHTTFGLGVRARLPFRAFALAGPGTSSRVVIDVANHW